MGWTSTDVRAADSGDLDVLVGLCLEAHGESALGAQACVPSAPVLREHFQGAMQTPDMHLLVAHLEGRTSGLALLRLVRPGLFSDTGWAQVEGLYVTAEHRRRGVGHALMAEIGHVAVAEGAERVVTMPVAGARGEQRFYARLGFAPAGPHRIAETAALVRRLDLELVPPDRRRARRVDHLIAARRRSRSVVADTDRARDLPLVAG